MKILTFVQLIFIGFSTFYFLRHYTSKDVPKFVKTICFISWFLSFAILAFVPLDIYSTLNHDIDSDQPTQNSDKFLMFVWRVLYWINFVFSWILLPLVKSYIDAGGFTWKEKLKQAILSKLKFYGIIAGLDILFIIYLEATGNGGGEGIMRFFITFTNCYGIIMIIICLSYGLVSIPKNCFQKARRGVYLKTHQFEAAVIDEQREALNFKIIDLIKNMEALLRRNDVDPSLKELLTQIIAKAPEDLQVQGKDMVGNSELPNPEVYENFNRNKAAKLNKKMTKRLSELKRLDHQWHVTVKHALMLEDLIESRNPCEWKAKISDSPPSENSPTLERNLTTLLWIWHVYIARLVYFLAGFVFIAFSIIIFFAEVFNFDDFDIYNVESFIKSGGGAVAKSQLLCLIPLIYIAMCVYSGVFNMKLAGCRNLYQHQQTDAPSLIFASLSLSRVSSPLVFNFLQMLNIEGTAFHAVMGNVKFANSFIRYFPLLLSLLVLCNIFEVYDRVLNKFGLGKFQFNAVYSNERIQEGKTLLTKARDDRNRQMGKLNLQNNQPSNGDRQGPGSEGEVSITSTKANSPKPGSTCKESAQQGYLMNNDKNRKILSIGSMGDIE